MKIRPKGTLGHREPGWRPKNRKERSSPLTAEFQECLRSGAFSLDPAEDFTLMPHVKQGKNRYRYDFRKPLQEYFLSKGVDATAHDLRRTFASLRIMAGVNLTKVARWIDDGYQTTFEHYSWLMPDRDADIEKDI